MEDISSYGAGVPLSSISGSGFSKPTIPWSWPVAILMDVHANVR
jgi:hypothetical protein